MSKGMAAGKWEQPAVWLDKAQDIRETMAQVEGDTSGCEIFAI